MAAKNGKLTLDGAAMDYIRFGSGKRALIILPGLGDGLQTVKGTALPMVLSYWRFGRSHTVYAFSRREPTPQGADTRAMAADVALAMEQLGIEKADILGVSMGGMIAQHLAIAYPEKVGRLVLAVSAARATPTVQASVTQWMETARAGDHTRLMDENVRAIYSPEYYRKNKFLIPLMGLLTKPRSYDRFLILSQACLTHDAYGELPRIQAPTLVLAGGQDRVLGSEAAQELAERIPGARCKVYPQWGHGLYDEAPDFQETVLRFLREDTL